MEIVKGIRPASDRSLHVSFGDEISMESYGAVMRLTRALAGARGILNLHPAYASVLVDFDPRLRTHEQIEALVRECLGAPGARGWGGRGRVSRGAGDAKESRSSPHAGGLSG